MKENIFIRNPEKPHRERVIITGGTEGIGEAIADQLSKEGSDIAICARTQEKALRVSKGRIVFLTSAAKNIEGAESYGKSKGRIEKWLIDFASRPENEGLQIFSVIPGSCNTNMHEEVLRYGHGEVKKRTEEIISRDGLRNPRIIGKIISKMSVSGNKFNPETGKYDLKIGQCEVVPISDENIRFEEVEEVKEGQVAESLF